MTLVDHIPWIRRNERREILAVVIGSLIIAGCAQITLEGKPFFIVPSTGQTFAVLLISAVLGPVRAGFSVALYLTAAAGGLPVLAGGESGASHLASSSGAGGYLWGFLLCAIVVGFCASRGWDRSIGSALGLVFLGEIIIFTVGVVWIVVGLDLPIAGAAAEYDDALDFGLYPYVLGDAVKAVAAATVLRLAWRLVGSRRPDALEPADEPLTPKPAASAAD